MPVRERRARASLCALLALALLAASILPGCMPVTPRVVKVGLVAPFEGRYREIGSDVIPAVRLAIREWSALSTATSDGPGLTFELVAYDDQGNPAQAAEQARKLAADPAVEIVVGHWRDATTQAALSVYDEFDLPLVTFVYAPLDASSGVFNLAPSFGELSSLAQADVLNPASVLDAAEIVTTEGDITADAMPGPIFGLGQFAALAGEQAEGLIYLTGAALPTDSGELSPEQAESFAAAYAEGSLGAPPGPLAVSAYQAAWVAMTLVARQHGYEVPETPVPLPHFDEAGRRVGASVYRYRWHDGQRVLVERLTE